MRFQPKVKSLGTAVLARLRLTAVTSTPAALRVGYALGKGGTYYSRSP